MRFVSVDPLELRIRERYELLTSAVAPRPIAFVSTISSAGIANLAPFSFFMAGGSNPPSVMFAPALNRQGEPKDSLRNVQETGEFVINSVTRGQAQGMNETSYDYPHEFNEWEVSGFTQLPSDLVAPPRVAESLVQMECKLHMIAEHGEGNGGARYVIGEVVRVHVAEDCWTGSGIDASIYKPISRMGGPNYLDTEAMEMFVMPRPASPAETKPDSK